MLGPTAIPNCTTQTYAVYHSRVRKGM